MNEMNPLETELSSWKPRPPSKRLERRLFRTGGEHRPLRLTLPWFAPAMAGCMMLMLMLNPHSGTALSGADNGPLVAMAMSNQSYAAFLPGSFQREQNRWDTFGWTNTGGFPSSNKPFLRVSR